MKTIYQCEICGKSYTDQLECEVCEAHGIDRAPFKVGDIVLCKGGFGWFDGDERWVSNPNARDPNLKKPCKHPGSNCFSDCCTYFFYYVVTDITHKEASHQWKATLATKAMTGKQGYRVGWTSPNHIPVKVVEHPPGHVLADSKNLIGIVAGRGQLL